MSGISVKNAEVAFGNVKALDGLSLDIADGAFAALVGPAGCGKSTVLRVIAGLDRLKNGEVIKDGEVINDVEPKLRDMAMVFENYALYPNKTVYDNLAYGLKLRKTDNTEIDARVKAAAELVGITRILDKKPKALSAADVKRAELARVVVRRPSVFLLDEPLGRLNGKDRIDALLLIRRLWQDTGITFIYATQSFDDAAALGAEISVMNGGNIVQTGTKLELTNSPFDLFVARISSPLLNVFEASMQTENDKTYAVFGSSRIEVGANGLEKAYLCVRPEDVTVTKTPTDGRGITATIDAVERLGAERVLYMYTDGKPDYTVARTVGEFEQGDNVSVYFDPQKLMLFDAETEKNIDRAEA